MIETNLVNAGPNVSRSEGRNTYDDIDQASNTLRIQEWVEEPERRKAARDPVVIQERN